MANSMNSLFYIKRKKFVTITHGHFCNTKLSVMRKNASQPHFIRDFPSVSAIQGQVVVMLKKFVMQNLQLPSDCDKLFSLHILDSWSDQRRTCSHDRTAYHRRARMGSTDYDMLRLDLSTYIQV